MLVFEMVELVFRKEQQIRDFLNHSEDRSLRTPLWTVTVYRFPGDSELDAAE